MSRKNPDAYPIQLRGMVEQVNIQRARSKEVLELLRELLLSGDHDRMGRLMNQQCDMCLLYCTMVDELTEQFLEFGDDHE